MEFGQLMMVAILQKIMLKFPTQSSSKDYILIIHIPTRPISASDQLTENNVKIPHFLRL
jgi:hypothetical protein